MGSLAIGFDVNHPKFKLWGSSPVLDKLSIVWESVVSAGPFVAPHHSLLNNYSYQSSLNILYMDLMSSIHLKLWRAWPPILDKLSIFCCKCGFGSSHSCASSPFSTQLISSGQHIRPLCNLGSLIRGFDVKLSSKLNFLRASGTIFDKLSVVWACVSHWALLKWDTYQGGNGTSTIQN